MTIRDIDHRAVAVAARLNLQGSAEVRGIRRYMDRPPTLTVVICGVEMDLTLGEAIVFRDAMNDGTTRLERAQGDGIAREPKGSDR